MMKLTKAHLIEIRDALASRRETLSRLYDEICIKGERQTSLAKKYNFTKEALYIVQGEVDKM